MLSANMIFGDLGTWCFRLAFLHSCLHSSLLGRSCNHIQMNGWSHACVLHGPEGCAVVSPNKQMNALQGMELVRMEFYTKFKSGLLVIEST